MIQVCLIAIWTPTFVNAQVWKLKITANQQVSATSRLRQDAVKRSPENFFAQKVLLMQLNKAVAANSKIPLPLQAVMIPIFFGNDANVKSKCSRPRSDSSRFSWTWETSNNMMTKTRTSQKEMDYWKEILILKLLSRNSEDIFET